MNYPRVALKVNSRQYGKLVDLANRNIVSLTGNLLYITPVPALSVIQTATTDLENAITAWGSVGNRGSKEDLLDLRNKAVILHQQLKALAEYVQNTATIASGNDYPAMAAMLGTSGFDLAAAKNPVGPLEPVRNFRVIADAALDKNKVRMKWILPANAPSTGDVDSYVVYRGTTPVFNQASQVAIVSKAEYVDTNTLNVPVTNFYWIVAYNPGGAGAVSDVLSVTLLGA